MLTILGLKYTLNIKEPQDIKFVFFYICRRRA